MECEVGFCEGDRDRCYICQMRWMQYFMTGLILIIGGICLIILALVA